MSAPGRRSLTGSVSKLSDSVQRIAGPGSPLREGKGEGEGCSSEMVLPGGLKPLTLILSPWPRGEAKKTAMGPTTGNSSVLA